MSLSIISIRSELLETGQLYRQLKIFYCCSNVVTPHWWSVYYGRGHVGLALGSMATIKYRPLFFFVDVVGVDTVETSSNSLPTLKTKLK